MVNVINKLKIQLKKLSVLLIIVTCLFIMAGCQEPDQDMISYQQINYHINSINHRGYYTAPENTLVAFRESVEHGFTMVECDVSFTKDGYAVLLHDSTVNRTSNGTGSIGDLTLKEVRNLDFGSWKFEQYAGEKIPTFDEFILLCRNLSLQPYIEIKFGATYVQVESLLSIVIKYGMRNHVTWISFDKSFLKIVSRSDKTARLGYIVKTVSEDRVKEAIDLQTDFNQVFIDCNYLNVNQDAISLCINNMIPLEVWTVDGKEDILNLDPYISGVTSNKLVAGEVLFENAYK